MVKLPSLLSPSASYYLPVTILRCY
uniref:Uncharacterized protein n=1 Tax=Arundo donax TaxID=35708 RepID=A0A0A8ZIS5_ARUDO